MFVTKKTLPRRTVLRGLGASLALPLLDAMVPAMTAVARTAAKPIKRIGFIYDGNGTVPSAWIPTTAGPGFELPPIMKPFAPVRDYVTVVSGLAHRQADSFGDGNGDHPRGTAAWLTGVHAWDRRSVAAVKLSTSADQIIAKHVGKDTYLPSLEVALENATQISCDSGDCFFSNTVSWRSPTTPNPMEDHPRVVFERLFGDSETPAQRRADMRVKGSILDSLADEAASLTRVLGPSDQTKMKEYLEAVRDLEQRIQQTETYGERELTVSARPIDIPASLTDYSALMFDLVALAYQADLTRVFTMMMSRETSGRTYSEIGVPEGGHAASHHRRAPEVMAKRVKILAYHAELLTSFLEKMRATPDGDGSLLDHSITLWGGGLGDGDLHDHTNLPLLLAGKGAGTLKGGRHVAYPPADEIPMANLLLTLMDKMDVPTPERIGDSTGHLRL